VHKEPQGLVRKELPEHKAPQGQVQQVLKELTEQQALKELLDRLQAI
jgi:hypothetical protein